MQNESTIEVQAEDKLRWLRRLDGGRGWESLDDRRVCRYCGKTFSGRQVQLVGGTRGHGPVRFVCPTPNCVSTPADWLYPHVGGAASKPPQAGASVRFSFLPFNFTFVIFMPSSVGCIVWLGFLVSPVSAQKLRHSFGNLYHACLTSIVAIDDKREIEWFLETPDHVVLIRRKN